MNAVLKGRETLKTKREILKTRDRTVPQKTSLQGHLNRPGLKDN